jgi:type I restriction enzyme R subunit
MRFGTDFSEKDKFFIQELENKLDINPSLESSIKVNDPENVKLTFDIVANSLVQDMCETNFKFYKHINDDEDFQKFFFSFLFDRYYKRAKGEKK